MKNINESKHYQEARKESAKVFLCNDFFTLKDNGATTSTTDRRATGEVD